MQENHIPETTRAVLVTRFAQVSAEVLGASPGDVQVHFKEIPHGAGYRGGELSTTSLVRGAIPAGCEQAVREKLLDAICEMWCSVTGCEEDQVVVSASDNNYVSKVY